MDKYKGYIKADFTNDFPLQLGDKFYAKDKSGRVFHYSFCGYKDDPCGNTISIYNDNVAYGYSQVEHEWFRQREIYLNPFNKGLMLLNAPEDFRDILHKNEEFRYQLLDRLRTDCNYYLGHGNRLAENLWAKSETEQIHLMKLLWNFFSEAEKPEWLTMGQIQEFEKQMLENFRECVNCETKISFESPDIQKGLLFACMRCQDPFCQSCFIEAHGEVAYSDMVKDNDADIRCPRCYTKS